MVGYPARAPYLARNAFSGLGGVYIEKRISAILIRLIVVDLNTILWYGICGVYPDDSRL